MKKIIILGSDSMAGHMIVLYLLGLKKYDIYDFCQTRKIRKKSQIVDVTDLNNFEEQVDIINPDIIINCIDTLNQNPIKASYINAFFPKYLVNKFINTSCKIIHISSDSVFDGRGLYDEIDIKNSTSIYGITKEMGEFDNDKDLTIRTSIIGPDIKEGNGLFNWFMKQEDAIDGEQNVWWTGLTNLELAMIIDFVIEKDITGSYNIVPNEKINKCDLLNILKTIFKKDTIKIYVETKVKADNSLITKINDLHYNFKSYYEMIDELSKWMNNHPKYYQRYFGLKDKIIIAWSKLKVETIPENKREEWVKHRIKIFMNYTYESFKNQTNQNFYYFINYDEYAKPYVIDELKKYPQLTNNILFTEHYYIDIEKIIPFYKNLYFVRIDSDDMFQKNFMQKLNDYKPKSETKALLVENGYIYDILTDEMARWVYKPPYFSPFYTLIYDSFDFSNGYRHETHGPLSVFKSNNEVIYGDNFIVIVHHQNTATTFHCSFRKQIVDDKEKERIKLENNLRMITEI